jgi:hypothetical protein
MQPTGPEEEFARERVHDREPHPLPHDSIAEREDVIRHETGDLPEDVEDIASRSWLWVVPVLIILAIVAWVIYRAAS